MNNWISVKDRLPTVRDEYLVFTDTKRFDVATYFTAAGYTGDADWEDKSGRAVYPTHWMPLPQKPEEDK